MDSLHIRVKITWNDIVVCSQVKRIFQHREPKILSGVFRDVLMKFARLVAFVNTAEIMLANLQICGIGADNANFIFLSFHTNYM